MESQTKLNMVVILLSISLPLSQVVSHARYWKWYICSMAVLFNIIFDLTMFLSAKAMTLVLIVAIFMLYSDTNLTRE